MSGDSCIFCAIVRRELPCHLVLEDELTVAFMDIAPVTDGHVLIVTRDHYANLLEAEPAALAAVMSSAKRVAHAIERRLQPDGLMVFQLNGAAAGQTVFHYHMHLMPRAEGEPLALHARRPGDPARLAEIAGALSREIGSAR